MLSYIYVPIVFLFYLLCTMTVKAFYGILQKNLYRFIETLGCVYMAGSWCGMGRGGSCIFYYHYSQKDFPHQNQLKCAHGASLYWCMLSDFLFFSPARGYFWGKKKNHTNIIFAGNR